MKTLNIIIIVLFSSYSVFSQVDGVRLDTIAKKKSERRSLPSYPTKPPQSKEEYVKLTRTVFAQNDLNDLSDKVNLRMIHKESPEGTILICTIENKDSVGFWVAFFSSSGNKIMITDSLGRIYNRYDFISCGRDSSMNYIYPLSTKTWEYNLSEFFAYESEPSFIRKRKIPEGEYYVFWDLYYRPARQKIRSREIIYHFKRP